VGSELNDNVSVTPRLSVVPYRCCGEITPVELNQTYRSVPVSQYILYYMLLYIVIYNIL